MSDYSNGIQALLGAPTSNDYAMQHQQVAQNNILLANQMAAQQVARQQQQAQIAQLVQAKQAMDEYTADPSDPVKFNRAISLNPQAHEAVAAGYKGVDEAAKSQAMLDSTSFLGKITSGDVDGAKAQLEASITADQKANKPVDEDTHILGLLNSGKPEDIKKVQAYAQLHTYGLAGADKFAEAYPNLVKLPSDVANTEAKITEALANASTKPSEIAKNQSETVKNISDATVGNISATEDPETGGLTYVSTKQGPIGGSEGDSAAVLNLNASTDKILGTEYPQGDGIASNIKNPNSSALGPSQALASTWLDTVKTNFPELMKGKSPKQVLALRTDPSVAIPVAREINKANISDLSNAGLPVNTATAALAYKLGAGDAKKVLNAPPNTPLDKLLSPQVMKANPNLQGKTAVQYTQELANQVGTNPIRVGDPNATGDAYLATLPRGRANLVAQIAKGEVAPPTGKNGVSEAGSGIMNAVMKYDPTFVADRYQLRKDLSDQSTPVGKSINAQNTLIQHLAKYAELNEQRNATSGGLPNLIGNAASSVARGKTAEIARQMNDLGKVISLERRQVFNGDSDKELEALSKNIKPDADTKDNRIAIKLMYEAAQDKVNSSQQQFQQRAKMPAPANAFIFPETQKVLSKLERTVNQREPNNTEISYLLKNPTPSNIAHFNNTFGEGSSSHYLHLGASH